jgi:tetratricopeptide (TPR) repeat protein
VNALLFAVLAALVVLTLDLCLSLPGLHAAPEASRRLVSVGLGLLFLLHPVGAFVVEYIWQRISILAALFFMLAFLLYMAVRMGRISSQVRGYAAAALCFVLAMACKENSITLPAVLLLAEVAFFRSSTRELVRRGLAFALMALFTMVLLSPLERPHGGAGRTGILHTLGKYYTESGLSVPQVVLAECAVVFAYLKMLLLPVPAHVHLLAAQLVPTSLFDPPGTALAALGILILVVGGLVLLKRRPLVGFGLLFFLGNLVPEALIVPQYLFCGYRVLVPMIGLLFVGADGLLLLSNALARPRAVLAAGFSLAAVFLASVAGIKAGLWQDSRIWWKDVLSRLPAESRVEKHIRIQALSNVGYYMQRDGKVREAIPLLKEAVQVDETVPYAYWVLGAVYRKLGDWKQAGDTYRRLLAVDPLGPMGYAGLGAVHIEERRYALARAAYQKAIELDPLYPDYHYGLALAALLSNDAPVAERELKRTLELNPGQPLARYNLGKLLTSTGHPQEGLEQFDLALALDPSLWVAHNARGITLARHGHLHEAIAAFQAVLTIRPGEPSATKNLAAIQAALPKK